MATADTYPHVILEANGNAFIEGTRYTVEHIAAEQYFYGWSAEEILRQHPDLRPAEVYAALAYFHDHHDTIVAAIEARKTQAERARSSGRSKGDAALFRSKRAASPFWASGILKRKWRNQGKYHPDSGPFGAQREASPASTRTGQDGPLTEAPRPPGG